MVGIVEMRSAQVTPQSRVRDMCDIRDWLMGSKARFVSTISRRRGCPKQGFKRGSAETGSFGGCHVGRDVWAAAVPSGARGVVTGGRCSSSGDVSARFSLNVVCGILHSRGVQS